MLGKLFFKRLLPGTVLYYLFVQVYVLYNSSNGKPNVLAEIAEPAIAVTSLPASVQANRKNMLERLWNLYTLNSSADLWDDFIDNAVWEEPNLKIVGRTPLEKIFRVFIGFVERSQILVKDNKIKVKSEVHYKSRIRLEIDFVITMSWLGIQKMGMTTWLELVKHGDTEKIVRLLEEWNHVPLITEENTLFPVGWSAERFRSIHGKLLEIICTIFD